MVITFVGFAASWQLASTAAASRPAADIAEARVSPPARGAARAVTEAVAPSRITPSGQVVVFSLGVPLTVVDGTDSFPIRVPRATTVADALSLAGVALGPLDRVAVAQRTDGLVASGDIIRVVRVTAADTVVREEIPFAVQTVNDATVPVGKTVVATAGVAGQVENTYRVTTADGVQESRTLIVTVHLSDPVAEVRHVGTMVVATPKPITTTTVSYGSGDIQSIIVAAANRFGVDPNWLLRIAKCESGFNPNAYNPSGASGLFQFMPATFAANSVRAGYAGASIWDPVASANTAAYMFSRNQSGQWVCK